MRFGLKTAAAVIAAGMMMFGGAVTTAEAADHPAILKPVEKLGRGVANVAFGPMELLMKTYDTTQELGGIAGLCYGPLLGVCYTVAREVVGVVDIATFLFPLPNCPEDPNDYGWGYGPIMRPAWVVDVEHNWGNFFYDDDVMANSTY